MIGLTVSVEVKHHVYLESSQSPGEVKSLEVELGSHSWMGCLADELFLSSWFSKLSL